MILLCATLWKAPASGWSLCWGGVLFIDKWAWSTLHHRERWELWCGEISYVRIHCWLWWQQRTNAHAQCVMLSVCEEDLHVKRGYSQFFHRLCFHHTWPRHPDVLWVASKISWMVRIGQNSWRKRWELIWTKTTARSQTFLLLKVMRGLLHVDTQIAPSLHLFYISIERFFFSLNELPCNAAEERETHLLRRGSEKGK